MIGAGGPLASGTSLGSYKSHRSSRSPVASAETWKQRWQRRCYGVLAHPLFDGVMGALITLNTLVIGVELMVFPPMTTPAPEGDAVFESLEHAFLLIYVAELSARIFACGMKCMRTNWVRFDFVLVSFGVVDSWLVPLVLLCAGEAVQKSWSPPTFMRILKLGRLARSLRLFVQFRTLWMLVSGLSQSLTTIVNVFIVLSLTLFIFACLGIEMITSNPKSFDEGTFGDIVNDYWSTLPKVMLTLVQFVTLDSIGQIYKPLIEEDWMLVLFFIPFILVVSVVVMNLVTAVVIEVFLDHAKRDQEMRQIYKNHYTRAILPQLRAMFEDLDADGNGYITLVELQHASEELQMDLGKLLNVDSLFDLFDALDADGSGEISIDEFLEGITQLSATNSRGLELTRILNMLKLILRHVAPQDPVTRTLSALPSARRAAPSSGAQSPKSPKSPKRRGGGGWAAAAARRAPDRSARSPA
ncbi:unnamed protein product [Prorocentrum cordatum]|uniref:EF-hand domain-containing protein n=1 Tax=Prorocentrum cordatum TaxID=2364126 RepID=A0ABN9QC82_9DINO|nr:unnamed protein product [Polarella glacialis]